MENASKALLIAAGVLFAMAIISLMAYMSSQITEIGEAQESKKAAEQLMAFNAEYEAYNKKLMYGTDVVTIINKAKEDGIEIVLDGVTMVDSSATLSDVQINIENAKLDPDDPNYEGLKIYECIDSFDEDGDGDTDGIFYDLETGKVNKMKFEEKTI